MNNEPAVTIGKATALYDIPPSTLRWWESQGVLPGPPRGNGRRLYDETELRRIGLAYLCCVIGGMSLEQAAVVTTGHRNDRWQRTVRSQAGLLEEKINELRSAHEYLLHLLECPDDDIVDECPLLDDELMNHTPRGRAPAPSLVAAAQSAFHHTSVSRRDETVGSREETEASVNHCAVCSSSISQPATGRRRRYCSRACQQRHYRGNARRHST